MTAQDAGHQPPTRDRIREFERPPSDVRRLDADPPPETPSRADASPPPAGLSSWLTQLSSEVVAALPRAVDAAPLVLAMALGFLVLRRRRWRTLLVRGVLCITGAVAAGLAVFYGTFLLGCRAMTCVDTAGLVPMVAGLGTGLVAGVVGLVILWRATGRRASAGA